MGVLLTNRNGKGDEAKGIEWLEKAVSAGHPAAAHDLALVLLGREDEASATRGKKLLALAVCAGYPEAVQAWEAAGGSKESLSCAPTPETDFSGEWSVSLKWDKAAAPMESYRISIKAGVARVSMQIGDQWEEVKPGKFAVAQIDQSLTVSMSDSGWDYDGKWIESWTIQLMRTGPDEASVAYLRTVNNPYLPARFAWRTFSNFAAGTALRTSQ
jgi:hypothetical protein